jgi:hypothetical protein
LEELRHAGRRYTEEQIIRVLNAAQAGKMAKDFIVASGQESVDIIEINSTMTVHADPGSSWSATYDDCDDILRVFRSNSGARPSRPIVRRPRCQTTYVARFDPA